jgi:hypothetical protein
MKVYHGTSMSNWGRIKKEGLLPRGNHGTSNWTHSIESNPDTIYLTDAYPMHFGMSAIRGDSSFFEEVVLIEVDTDSLTGLLVPDEDALEQVGRYQQGGDGLPTDWDMQTRTRYYREEVKAFAKKGIGWEWSLGVLGTMGHIGAITPEHFTKIAVIDIAKERALAFASMDMTVSVMNYKFVGAGTGTSFAASSTTRWWRTTIRWDFLFHRWKALSKSLN